MTNRSLAAPALVAAVAFALAGCGSSADPGIQPAPSAGLTQAPKTTTPTTPTTTPTPKPTVPLPSAFKTKPTVTIPSGPPPKTLVIKNLITGTGPAVTSSSTINVAYVGVLYKNGKQFDASWNDSSGAPITEPLAAFIPGWKQGLVGMKEGGRRELIIPPSLAYGKAARPSSGGSNGSGGKDVAIPANSTLVFVVDLHAVS
jgi:peptidylprolyl isomerase